MAGATAAITPAMTPTATRSTSRTAAAGGRPFPVNHRTGGHSTVHTMTRQHHRQDDHPGLAHHPAENPQRGHHRDELHRHRPTRSEMRHRRSNREWEPPWHVLTRRVANRHTASEIVPSVMGIIRRRRAQLGAVAD